jgi:hypothetical protein
MSHFSDADENPFALSGEKIHFPLFDTMPLPDGAALATDDDDGDLAPEDDIEYLAEVRGRPFVLPGAGAAMWHPHSPVGRVSADVLDADRRACDRYWAERGESPLSACGGGGVTVREALHVDVSGGGCADDGSGAEEGDQACEEGTGGASGSPRTPIRWTGGWGAASTTPAAGQGMQAACVGASLRCDSDRSVSHVPHVAGALCVSSPFSALPPCLTGTGTPAPRRRSRLHGSGQLSRDYAAAFAGGSGGGGVGEEEEGVAALGSLPMDAVGWDAAGMSPIPAPPPSAAAALHAARGDGGWGHADAGCWVLRSCGTATRAPSPGCHGHGDEPGIAGIARNLCPTLDASMSAGAAHDAEDGDSAAPAPWDGGWRSAATTHCEGAVAASGGGGEAAVDISMIRADGEDVGGLPIPVAPGEHRSAHLSPLHAVREARRAACVTSPAAAWDFAAWSCGRLSIDALCERTRPPPANPTHLQPAAGVAYGFGAVPPPAIVLPMPPLEALASLRQVAGRMDSWGAAPAGAGGSVDGHHGWGDAAGTLARAGGGGGTMRGPAGGSGDGSLWHYPRGLYSSGL